MAKTFNRMRIDVNTEPVDIITEVQADSNSRYLDVFLYDGGVPIDLTGHEVRIYMRKPENSGEIWNNGEITEPTNGRCQFLLTTQALEKMGYLKTQISIWKNNEEILSTQIFNIFVTENLRTAGSIESSNEYGALVVLFQNLYEAHDLMTTIVQNMNQLLGASGAVKSVQRGTVNAGAPTSITDEFKYYKGSAYSRYIDITISAVNPVKSSISVYYANFTIPVLISETTLRVYYDSASNTSSPVQLNNGLSWEVIEFY